MSEVRLKRVTRTELPDRRTGAVDAGTLEQAAAILREVREGGEPALRACAERFGDRQPGEPLVLDRAAIDRALEALDATKRGVLERTAARIRAFAEAQRRALTDLDLPIEGGIASHRVTAVESAGCYAPGGRFPLPSSVLMTAVTARAAGVERIWVASPRPSAETIAAAAIAGADALLCVGGAQAIAALAYGVGDVPACDCIVGPGNRWVTAAKQLISGRVRIDMLAGPSELVIVADESSDPALLAADLLAQAEHDVDAIPILITTDADLIERVEVELAQQLADLPTAATARESMARNGFALVAGSLDEAIALTNELAPEHLQLCTADARDIAPRFRHYGSLFIGERTAEVFGDYGAGPNHTLPTGGTARFSSGLSVYHFLCQHTQLAITDPSDATAMMRDAIDLARMEGLEAHARAAERRR